MNKFINRNILNTNYIHMYALAKPGTAQYRSETSMKYARMLYALLGGLSLGVMPAFAEPWTKLVIDNRLGIELKAWVADANAVGQSPHEAIRSVDAIHSAGAVIANGHGLGTSTALLVFHPSNSLSASQPILLRDIEKKNNGKALLDFPKTGKAGPSRIQVEFIQKIDDLLLLRLTRVDCEAPVALASAQRDDDSSSSSSGAEFLDGLGPVEADESSAAPAASMAASSVAVAGKTLRFNNEMSRNVRVTVWEATERETLDMLPYAIRSNGKINNEVTACLPRSVYIGAGCTGLMLIKNTSNYRVVMTDIASKKAFFMNSWEADGVRKADFNENMNIRTRAAACTKNIIHSI